MKKIFLSAFLILTGSTFAQEVKTDVKVVKSTYESSKSEITSVKNEGKISKKRIERPVRKEEIVIENKNDK